MPTAKLPERITCVFCGKQIDPAQESLQSWRRVVIDGRWFYACPLEFPPAAACHADLRVAADRFLRAAEHLAGQVSPPSAAVAAAGGAR
jgi:hypothetical protein